MEGILENIMSLHQAKFSSELQSTIDSHIENNTEIVTAIIEMCGKSLEEVTKIDDFAPLFNSFSLKICWAFSLVTGHFF